MMKMAMIMLRPQVAREMIIMIIMLKMKLMLEAIMMKISKMNILMLVIGLLKIVCRKCIIGNSFGDTRIILAVTNLLVYLPLSI